MYRNTFQAAVLNQEKAACCCTQRAAYRTTECIPALMSRDETLDTLFASASTGRSVFHGSKG